ncbi:hypothetical protein EV679_0223 [Kerstersia gyiorum]|uniref:Transferrin-binding protein B C-lobe/N-lobe beta barrel domain-containing protein n=1 Tax=Kerstersia gyiorum TaxID=206506 RepID=A0A4Q7N0E9_9BURK|nr:hypothetical protein [Kerstersia gyiorum]KAB0544063.1 hypothetical protein F7P85_05430 [Kerstersia gyiorum]MCR4157900.1 hypothetical protein [Kerstersia gyiorum]RZS73039.1 hypothetical protein EV679_0223 [Kerstersia gyiorum]
MKHVILASALIAIFGAAQAQTVPPFNSVGSTTSDLPDNQAPLRVGGSTLTGFHGPLDAPGIGFNDPSRPAGYYIISLQSINNFSPNGSITTDGKTFSQYRLNGYSHADDPSGPVISTNFNWGKVNASARQVYYGIATDHADNTSTRVDTAFEVGDNIGFVVPVAKTEYAAAGFVALASRAASVAPTTLTGTLTLEANYQSLHGELARADGLAGLDVSATNIDASAGTFSGQASYVDTQVGYIIDGTTKGHFYSSGDTSSLAGVASGSNSADSFVASFGATKK